MMADDDKRLGTLSRLMKNNLPAKQLKAFVFDTFITQTFGHYIRKI